MRSIQTNHKAIMSHALIPTILVLAYENDLDAFVPEIWAQESLMILENNMILGNLVHRDFENQIASFGDTVNTRKPSKFTMNRKGDVDSVTIQDANATNVAVKLDQHLHTSFLIKDGQEAKGFKNLVQEYLYPAILSIAEGVDQILAAQTYQFLPNAVGTLSGTTNAATLIAARDKMNQLLVPSTGRNIVMPSNMEAALLSDANFVTADKVGDNGTALREGSLGRKYGFDLFMAQQQPSIATGNTVVVGAINSAPGHAVGVTAVAVDGFAAAITNGSWCMIGGRPYLITATVGGATPTQLTLDGGLTAAVVDNAVVTVYTPAAVNLVAGYAAGHAKSLVIDGTTAAPRRGQLISFGTTAPRYGTIGDTSTTSITLDRPLDAAAADNAVVGLGPAGNYGLAFHRNAMALITRPLATPMVGTGARSFVANYNGLSLRVTITYNGEKQGHLVTVDVLAGVKVLDSALGVPVLG
jgi:hypothetical protein